MCICVPACVCVCVCVCVCACSCACARNVHFFRRNAIYRSAKGKAKTKQEENHKYIDLAPPAGTYTSTLGSVHTPVSVLLQHTTACRSLVRVGVRVCVCEKYK